jgi:transposase
MFGLGPATRIYIALDAIDMRKGFDGLYGLVRDHLGQDPQSGHLFLFTNRSHTRVKVLVWDGSGLWVCAKRLERGRFGWPAANASRSVTMRPEELAMLLNGMDLKQARPRKNWMRHHTRGLAETCKCSSLAKTFLRMRVVCAQHVQTLAKTLEARPVFA